MKGTPYLDCGSERYVKQRVVILSKGMRMRIEISDDSDCIDISLTPCASSVWHILGTHLSCIAETREPRSSTATSEK